MKMKKIKKFILKGLPVFLAVLFILQLVPRHFYAAAGARLANFFAGNETWSVNRQEPPLLSEEVSEPSLKEDLSIDGETNRRYKIFPDERRQLPSAAVSAGSTL